LFLVTCQVYFVRSVFRFARFRVSGVHRTQIACCQSVRQSLNPPLHHDGDSNGRSSQKASQTTTSRLRLGFAMSARPSHRKHQRREPRPRARVASLFVFPPLCLSLLLLGAHLFAVGVSSSGELVNALHQRIALKNAQLHRIPARSHTSPYSTTLPSTSVATVSRLHRAPSSARSPSRHQLTNKDKQEFEARKNVVPADPGPPVWVVSFRRTGTHLTLGLVYHHLRGPWNLVKANHPDPTTLSCTCWQWMQANNTAYFLHPRRNPLHMPYAMYSYLRDFADNVMNVGWWWWWWWCMCLHVCVCVRFVCMHVCECVCKSGVRVKV
jgi:hypothetical protein